LTLLRFPQVAVSNHHVKATIANNDVVGYEHRMACPEMDLRHGLGDVVTGYVTEYNNEGACQYFFTHTQKLFYKTGPTAITLKQRLLAKPTAAWRVVYSGQVHSVDEIVIDELARLAGKDEFEYRMEMLDSDRHRAVLDKAAHEAQWGRKLPAGGPRASACTTSTSPSSRTSWKSTRGTRSRA
jgi:isoquinoline 1-oxidoreductase beta subunit